MIVFGLFLFGLVMGSFVYAISLRLLSGKTVWGRSACESCKRVLKWYELLPVMSYVYLRGRCRRCHVSISWRYPLVEVSVGIAFALIGFQHHTREAIMLGIVIVTVLAITFLTDVLEYAIFLSVLAVGGILTTGLHWYMGGLSLRSLVLGVVVGGGFFLVQYVLSRGKWVGSGDGYLGVFLGLVFGFPQVLLVILSAYVAGAIIALGLLLAKKKTRASRLPLGAFLAPAGIVFFLFQDTVQHVYESLWIFPT